MKKFLMALALVAVLATICTPAAFAAEHEVGTEESVSTRAFIDDDVAETH